MAVYVTAVARVSSWPLEYILWGLPYAAGLQMMHAEARYQGEEVEFVVGRKAEADGGMLTAFKSLRDKAEL